MPLYEYRCDRCGELFEVIQKFSDPPLSVHDKCGGTVHRLLSAPALQFKGSGWYVTDYAKSSEPAKDGGKKTDGATPAPSTESGGPKESAPGSSEKKTTASDAKAKAE